MERKGGTKGRKELDRYYMPFKFILIHQIDFPCSVDQQVAENSELLCFIDNLVS
jgi:hypothetical protein